MRTVPPDLGEAVAKAKLYRKRLARRKRYNAFTAAKQPIADVSVGPPDPIINVIANRFGLPIGRARLVVDLFREAAAC